MTSAPCPLLEMPETVMAEILGILDFPDVQVLRKTCHHLRNFIDDFQPDSKLLRLVIFVNVDCIDFKLGFDKNYDQYPKGKSIRIQYNQHENGCQVVWFRSDGRKTKILEGQHFVDAFSQNFQEILKNQKSKIQDFILNFEYFPMDHDNFHPITLKLMPEIEKTLESRLRPLLVQDFYTTVYELEQAKILKFFDSKFMEKISISDRKIRFEKKTWDLKDFITMEHWKNAKVVQIFDVNVLADIQNFEHFEELDLGFAQITVEDMMMWKETILNSKTLKSGRIYFDSSNAETHFLSVYGSPSTSIDRFGDEKRSWFFRIPNNENGLEIGFYNLDFASYFRFNRLKLADAPKNARVIH